MLEELILVRHQMLSGIRYQPWDGYVMSGQMTAGFGLSLEQILIGS
jgi:hypothetical protein